MSTIETIIPNDHVLQESECVTSTTMQPSNIEPMVSPKALTLFDHLIQIGNIHEKIAGVPESVIEPAKVHIDFVCETLDLMPIQAVLLADLLCLYDGSNTTLRELADMMKCKSVEVFQYNDEFIALEHKNLIVCVKESRHHLSSGGLEFDLPLETLTALRKGKRPENSWTDKLTADEFLGRVERLCEERVSNDENYDRTIRKFGLLTQFNQHLGIVKTLDSYELPKGDELQLLRFCLSVTYHDENEMNIETMGQLYSHRGYIVNLRQSLRRGNHILQRKELIENANSNGLAQHDTFCLTEKAKNELLADYSELMTVKTIRDMIAPCTITEKTLFYPDKTARSVQELSTLLQEENWQRVRENLIQTGMRTGFACLFSGAPGTGKTETAMQVAKATGRGIIQVDIADTKSKWFGESEKQIKALFNRYRAAVKSSDVMPILLFNEADAVIGKRQELDTKRTGPGQTENAMQNIILQEIENLDGILIATTNLTQNMDKAFERRFLYKIEFEKPTNEARRSIWLTMIPTLPIDDVAVLADRFEFSGGQIENISRRRTVAAVLHGTPPGLDELIDYCRDEQAGSEGVRRIGFLSQA